MQKIHTEVTIEAETPFLESLPEEWGDLLPEDALTKTDPAGPSLTLGISVSDAELDSLLQCIAQYAAAWEEKNPARRPVDIQIRNLADSEAPLGRGPFLPIPGLVLRPGRPDPCSPREAATIFLTSPKAFGTGTHPTTRLCLSLLSHVASTRDFSDFSVLDIGCGSGILALAAVSMGADRATGLEIDRHASQTAIANVAANSLEGKITIINKGLNETPEEHYDLVLANLVPSVLLTLADSIPKRLKTDGLLMVSGFKAAQMGKMRQTFEARAMGFVHGETQDNWGALLFLRPGPGTQ